MENRINDLINNKENDIINRINSYEDEIEINNQIILNL